MTYPTIKLKLTHKGKCVNVEAPANTTFGDLKVHMFMLLHLLELKPKCNEEMWHNPHFRDILRVRLCYLLSFVRLTCLLVARDLMV